MQHPKVTHNEDGSVEYIFTDGTKVIMSKEEHDDLENRHDSVAEMVKAVFEGKE